MTSGSDIYNSGVYLQRNSTWHAEDSAWKAGQIAKALNALRITPAKIADVGCGAGEVLVQLSRHYPDARCTGFEISQQGYDLAKGRSGERVSFVLGNATEHKGFDVAMAVDVFEHIEDFFGFLRNMQGMATYKVFHIPLDMSALAVAMNNPMWARREVGHLHYFSDQTAIAALQECGYEILGTWFTNGDALTMKTLFSGRAARKAIKLLALGLPRFMLSLVSKPLSARLLGGQSLLVVAK